MYGKTLNYNVFRVFGSACFVLVQSYEQSKLELHSRLCYFLDYGIEHKRYRCWDPILKRLHISRHVTFLEHEIFSFMFEFHLSEYNSPFFINPSVELFLEVLSLLIIITLLHLLLIFLMHVIQMISLSLVLKQLACL